MQASRKRYGVTVNVYLDGHGYDSDVALTCENADTAHLCRFARCEIMPMPEGAACCYREDGQCRLLCAQLDALEKAKAAVAAKIEEVRGLCEE